MSVIYYFMSFSDLRVRNRGAYGSPFSGVGVEFYPLGVLPDHTGVVLHESGYLPKNDWWNFPNTLSPFWRLYWNGRRGHEVIFAHGRFELLPDRLMLIPDHQLFDCRGTRPVPHLWLAFQTARRLDPHQRAPFLLRPTAADKSLIKNLISLHQASPPNRERIFHGSLALLHLVLSRPELHWQADVPARFVRVVRHIEEHHGARLRIPALARMVGMCPEAFTRSFKRYFGRSPARFVMEVRTREAAACLTNTEATLDDIAERFGFPNRAYFSRVFRQVTGESPARLRRRWKRAS